MSELTGLVIGAAIEVHRVVGPGFLESVYEEALAAELELRGVPCIRQKPVAVTYKGRQGGEGKLDLLVGNTLIVELKAVVNLTPLHEAQVLSSLKMTHYPLGLRHQLQRPPPQRWHPPHHPLLTLSS